MDESKIPFVALEISKDDDVEEKSSQEREKREKCVSTVVVILSLGMILACVFSVSFKVYESYVISQYVQSYVKGLETTNAACMQREKQLKAELYFKTRIDAENDWYDTIEFYDDENEDEYSIENHTSIQDKLWNLCKNIGADIEDNTYRFDPQIMTSESKDDLDFCNLIYYVRLEYKKNSDEF